MWWTRCSVRYWTRLSVALIQTITGAGIITATDLIGALHAGDIQVANYHVSSGNYTEWNSGWQYRNDGVDITFATDPVHSNGYKVQGELVGYRRVDEVHR